MRPANEDSYLCHPPVWAVADGLGGHPAGDVASALALEPLRELAERAASAATGSAAEDGDPAAALADAVREGNRRVHADAMASTERFGMGTTLTAAYIAGDRVHVAHVGDSRCYHWRRGDGLRQVTVDHTPAGEALAAGQLSAEQAAIHPERHVLARAVGLDPEVRVDASSAFALAPGDVALLCSDGLTEVVGDDAIADVLERSPDAASAVDELIGQALAGGGPDNVTVVVVRRS